MIWWRNVVSGVSASLTTDMRQVNDAGPAALTQVCWYTVSAAVDSEQVVPTDYNHWLFVLLQLFTDVLFQLSNVGGSDKTKICIRKYSFLTLPIVSDTPLKFFNRCYYKTNLNPPDNSECEWVS